ncbi:GntR family transcriptional regulator [Rodentibacter sp. Ppn85]|uniref:GntR family transcriptional regulator n=1 Tax=Rodentibacter sp. Ppn85 TaxID=1908525 RepID=UPI001E399AD0|nr:GntR family transcriptional regulator [Rodentibacter sp. Ppn85]
MSRNLQLRQNIINQIIEDIATELLSSPLPSQTELAKLYSVSRTTIRNVLQYLIQIDIIKWEGNQFNVTRLPDDEDKIFHIAQKKNHPLQLKYLEIYFQNAIQQKLIKPGDIFSELQLAKDANVDIYTVREYLMPFARFNLLTNVSRGKWKLTEFSPHYGDKLFELREILECHALRCFMKLPTDDPR